MRRVYLTLAGAYVVLRVGAIIDAAPVSNHPDSQEYLATAHQSLGDLFAGERSPTIALFYKLLPTNHLREAGQVVVSIAAWLGLAVALQRSVRNRRVKLAAYVAVLLFSLTPWVAQWDPVLLSESLSVSLTAGLIAVWLELIRKPTLANTLGLVALALLWATARDTNAYVLLAGLAVPLVWLVRSRDRRLPAVVLVGLLVAGTASVVSAGAGERWKVPLVNVIGHRVLPDERKLEFFQRRGLPEITPELKAELRNPGFIAHEKLRRLPEWSVWNDWLKRAGRQTYIRYLAAHPGYAISATYTTRSRLFNVQAPGDPASLPLSYYRPAGASDVLPVWLSDLLFPPTGGVLWLYLVLLAPAFFFARRRATAQWTVPPVLLALTVPHAFVIVLGDTNELIRHSLVLGVMVRLAFLLAAVFLADALIRRLPVLAAERTHARQPPERRVEQPV